MISHTHTKQPRPTATDRHSVRSIKKTARRTSTPAVVPAPVEALGLCAQCHEAPTCTFPRTPGKPVSSCDEFDGAPIQVGAKPKAALQAVSPGLVEAAEQGLYLGLCKCCERRATCTYPKPASGVWHCDEYE